MALIGQETADLLKHLVGNFVLAVVLFGVAIGLALVEKWCVEHQMPAYICYGTRAISFTLFTLDGIVLCGTAVIVSFRLLRKTWEHES